jgi:hypothetical protein
MNNPLIWPARRLTAGLGTLILVCCVKNPSLSDEAKCDPERYRQGSRINNDWDGDIHLPGTKITFSVFDRTRNLSLCPLIAVFRRIAPGNRKKPASTRPKTVEIFADSCFALPATADIHLRTRLRADRSVSFAKAPPPSPLRWKLRRPGWLMEFSGAYSATIRASRGRKVFGEHTRPGCRGRRPAGHKVARQRRVVICSPRQRHGQFARPSIER